MTTAAYSKPIKMRTSSLLATLSLAVFAYADCSSLGPGATDSLYGLFKLSAYRASTGTTQALNLLVVQTVPMTTYHIFSVNSGTSDGFINWSLSSGELSSGSSTSQYLAPVHYIGLEAPPYGSQIYPTPAPWLLFSNTFAPPSGVFCSVPNPAGGNNILALNGHTDLFSVCESSFSSSTTPYTDALLFNASSTSIRDNFNTYDGSSCTPVTVLLTPA